MTRRWRLAGAVAWPAAGIVTVLAVWWVATDRLGVRGYLLPRPQDVVATLVSLRGYLARHTVVTLAEVAAGYTLAVAGGIPVGLMLATWRPVRQAAGPILVGLHAVPKLPLAVPLVVGFGFGPGPKITMVVLVCAFPVVLSTVDGLRSTPAELVDLARSLCATRWQTHLKIRLPYALPQILHGCKQAAPLAVIGAVVGELFGATAGLGFTIRSAGTDLAQVWAALLILAALSLGLFHTVTATEKLLTPWTTTHNQPTEGTR